MKASPIVRTIYTQILLGLEASPFHIAQGYIWKVKGIFAIEIFSLKQFNHTQNLDLPLTFFQQWKTFGALQIFCNEAMQNHCLVMQMKWDLTEKHSRDHEPFAKTQSKDFLLSVKSHKLSFLREHCWEKGKQDRVNIFCSL